MANELGDALRRIGDQTVKYVQDAAELKVTTQYVRTDEADGKPRTGAQTVIKLDGDCSTIVPTRPTEAGLALESSIFESHEANVRAAIEYRSKVLHNLMELLKSARK